MRLLAIGDIHGCFNALTTLAEYVSITPDDMLVTLGDYVDRGPDTFGVISWLIARKRRGHLIALRGNHEIMMLSARASRDALSIWESCGGDAALASYSLLGDQGKLIDVPEEHWEFIESTQNYYETETHFFVHAGALPDCALADQPDYMLFWEAFDNPSPHESGKVMICGHTSQRSGLPRSVGHAVCIDTWVYGTGWLTCLDVATGKYWQANQKGQTRSGWLD